MNRQQAEDHAADTCDALGTKRHAHVSRCTRYGFRAGWQAAIEQCGMEPGTFEAEGTAENDERGV